jgi:serine/threonine protein kinase
MIPVATRVSEGTAPMKFIYTSGAKPLDGYTIKRGVGRGGFGEVYFAVSDGGKEVALKLIRGDGAVELRGIAHCLNLKHSNLVSLFDLRTDASGNQWVVMEYVAGDPLHTVLMRHPQGLPVELARQWFGSLARAVGYLHDHGIVHRDLKPANIFVEDGLLKVGDYGLCKSITSSQQHHTGSIGTVHYMAPELGNGNYGKSIDIYACGILLYEMLSGHVPFDGESVGEILIKHLTSTPDLSMLPFEFVPIVSKALAKNPAQRYASMAEMAQAVEALNAPAPQQQPPIARPAPIAPPPLPHRRPPDAVPAVIPVTQMSFRGLIGELAGSMFLAVVLSLLATLPWISLFKWNIDRNLDLLMSLFLVTVAVSWAVLIPTKFWGAKAFVPQNDKRERPRTGERGGPTQFDVSGPTGDGWGRRICMAALGLLIGLGAMWLGGWEPLENDQAVVLRPGDSVGVGLTHGHGLTTAAGYLSYFGLTLGAVRWWRMTERRRKNWFSLFPVLATGFWALVLGAMFWPWNEQPMFGAAALVMASAVVQWVSPWEPPPPAPPKRLRLRYA